MHLHASIPQQKSPRRALACVQSPLVRRERLTSYMGSGGRSGKDDVAQGALAERPTLLYRGIRLWFSACGTGFYATTEVHGLEHLPRSGPTIICFNHGNGLADPLLLIRKTPRMVRFCAKNTLWKVPVMKYFIRNSGAVPVYRAVEHGDTAKDLNTQVFAKVIEALHAGDCLGFAPEGVSRFLPYIEQPLKTGLARIAIEAVQQAQAAGDAHFSVALVPVGLTYTHREKFRSDVCIRYLPPLRVDAPRLEAYRSEDGSLDSYAAARGITQELSAALESITINAPTWDAMRLAITAARLHQPAGTQMTLSQYTSLVRGWAEVLSIGVEGRLQGTSKYTEGTPAERPVPPPKPASDEALALSNSLRTDLAAYQVRRPMRKGARARARATACPSACAPPSHAPPLPPAAARSRLLPPARRAGVSPTPPSPRRQLRPPPLNRASPLHPLRARAGSARPRWHQV